MTRPPEHQVQQGWRPSPPRWLSFALLVVFLVGCGQSDSVTKPIRSLPNLLPIEQSEPGTPTTSPTVVIPTPTPAQPTSQSIVPDSDWEEIGHGLERRVLNALDPNGSLTPTLYILRIDPDLYRFEVGYQPGDPQSLLEWRDESGALIVVNGGYFTEEQKATSLVVADGIASGISYQGFGGMFSVGSEGPDLRWLEQEPYSEAESLSAAVQSFPMLIAPGGKLAYKDESGEKARRTVIATDREGWFLLVISPSAIFTLAEMGNFLMESDLNIDAALNLDGGASTGLLLADPAEGIPAFSELPLVLLVYPR